jgi:hypothetical protein
MKNLETRRARPPADATARGRASVIRRDNRSVARREPVAHTRELARRQSGTIEVFLLWHPESNWVELAVRDLATDVSFHLEVAPADAVDAFYHPYAYAARPKRSGGPDGTRPRTRAAE